MKDALLLPTWSKGRNEICKVLSVVCNCTLWPQVPFIILDLLLKGAFVCVCVHVCVGVCMSVNIICLCVSVSVDVSVCIHVYSLKISVVWTQSSIKYRLKYAKGIGYNSCFVLFIENWHQKRGGT